MNKTVIKTNLIFSAVFILFIAIDRICKELAVTYLMKEEIELIPGILSLHYLENRGAAWGILENAFALFLIITILVLIAMLLFYVRLPFTKRYRLLRFTIIMMSAGAVGNFIDRICWRYVVDFIYLKCINFPVFNVADCFVCVAAVLLIYCLLFYYKDDDLSWKKS